MDILALSNFLQDSQKADEEKASESHVITPGDIGPSAPRQIKSSGEDNKPKDPKAIWSEDEVPLEGAIEDPYDERPAPEYDIVYKQLVGTQDVFGGFGDVTPASQDCTHLVVKIHFPGSNMSDLDLKVTKQHIRAESTSLKLSTYLPEPVEEENGNAKWDSKTSTLTITLPIDRTGGLL
mmetsp:Transcript_17153/g.27051  ORF Transcript_17153/g.27051 Transcript_17153/m.27051 type:complete len:179 (-) Transcript_17153:160-696(-)|eukprot:CAMPEP_0194589258 /NCGR_PEP_ID=MMETSP0292-20121207/20490_1 /TAXON_ID=39354 /ORGANISM="Heterosigma akashiwo, Strain CCMP2393" /LENGTH=178 /DNA_ID=CAMNT_0039446361 /DNA_START=81 /DNA_END=620 /DNA_ORIENTATION=-